MIGKKKINISSFSHEKIQCGDFLIPAYCSCCSKHDKMPLYTVRINNAEMLLCADCLNKLYDEIGQTLHRSVNIGDTVWELAQCDDGTWQIFPMIVKSVCPYGSVRWIKGKEPVVWNIYAESDSTYMYKSFYDVDKTLFFTEDDAKQALKEYQKE